MSTTPSTGPRIEGTVLDHIAHAVPRWQDIWHRYAIDFGATWASGGPALGFAPGQLRFANGGRVEVLMPHAIEHNDFLDRFLNRSGPGAHHLTFKVPNLADALTEVRRHGLEPIGINTSDPEWMEAFLHPKQSSGIVVQIAEAPSPWSSPPPHDYPTDRRMRRDGTQPTAPANLLSVCHVVADMDATTALFCGLLAGDIVDEGTAGGLLWRDVRWSGPLGLRLVSALDPTAQDPPTQDPPTSGPVAEWLGGLPGRVHHLVVEAEEPEAVPDAVTASDVLDLVGGGSDLGDRWAIAPADNQGLGIVLHAPSGPTESPLAAR